MDVVQISTSELAGMAAPYNPRRIADHDLEALRRSLRYFGTVEPIVVNRRTGHIVGGHQRVKAAEAAGIEKRPVVPGDRDDPSEKEEKLARDRPPRGRGRVGGGGGARPPLSGALGGRRCVAFVGGRGHAASLPIRLRRPRVPLPRRGPCV